MDPTADPTRPDAELAPALQRSRDEAVVAGVCHSLGRRLGVDPLLVRVAAILLALSSGFGVILYGWAWFVIPQQGRRDSLAQQWFPGMAEIAPSRLLTLGLVGSLVGSLVLGQSSSWSIGPGIVLLVLVVLGNRHRRQATSPVPEAPDAVAAARQTDFERAITAWSQRVLEVGASPQEPTPPVVAALSQEPRPIECPLPSLAHLPPPQARPVAPAPDSTVPAALSSHADHAGAHAAPRRSGHPWLAGLGIVTLAITAALLVPTAGISEPRLAQHAIMLSILAAGLLACWLLRRPRPHLVVLAGACVLGSALVPVPTNIAPIDVEWASTAQLPAEPQRVVATDAVYDLSRIDLGSPPGQPPRLAVVARASDVIVLVPEGAAVRVDYKLAAADLEIDQDGDDFTADGERSGSWQENPRKPAELVVDVDAIAATVEVRHVKPS